MDIAHFTAEALSAMGVRQVFGIPGGPSIHYMEAWREAGIGFVLTSHEAAAGIMADVTARITGIPGVCHATFGPGATNLATGVGCAMLDRSPVIAFTTEVPDKMLGRTTQMGIDHQQLFLPITKATYRLSPDTAGQVLSSAFETATAELPGPVHIGLPSDISRLDAGNQVFKGVKGNNTESAEYNEDEIISLLKASKRPLIAAGLTAVRCDAGKALLRFLERASIPVVLTPMAKGLIPSDHPSFSGVLFHALSDRYMQVTGSADLVIGLGYDPVEYNYESWMPEVPLVHFGTVPVDMAEGMNARCVTGTPGQWFEILEKSIPRGDYLRDRGLAEAVSEVNDVFNELGKKWGPVKIMQLLKNELPAETILTCDVGSHLHMAGQYWPSQTTGRMIITNGWSTMGFGIPAALAAAISSPESPVVCVAGDGGFLMSAGEIMTARRYRLNIKVVIISDRELNLIKVKQSWWNLDPYATQLLDGELFGSDKFLGVPILHAANMNAMQRNIRSALSIDGPVIINAIVPGKDYDRLIVRQ